MVWEVSEKKNPKSFASSNGLAMKPGRRQGEEEYKFHSNHRERENTIISGIT
jgi:hypothetical protein